METNTKLCPCCKSQPYGPEFNSHLDGWCHICKVYMYAEWAVMSHDRKKMGLPGLRADWVAKMYPEKRLVSPITKIMTNLIKRDNMILKNQKLLECTIDAMCEVLDELDMN